MKNEVYLGSSKLNFDHSSVEGTFVTIESELFFKIGHVQNMADFFMTIVSHSDHWMYLSSNGSLTAGRKSRDNALFPYYTVDKIHDTRDLTGSKTYCLVEKNDRLLLWEPFSESSGLVYKSEKNLYKSIFGNKVIFEDINHDLGLKFRYGWFNSEQFGWIKRAWIENISSEKISLRLLDGIKNILPYGLGYAFINEFSNLADAYKKSELLEQSGLGLFTLSSIPIDRAEPSEALKATTVWFYSKQEKLKTLISPNQLEKFRKGYEINNEFDIRAAKGAYFKEFNLTLKPSAENHWFFMLEINQDLRDVINLEQYITTANNIEEDLVRDIQNGTEELIKIVASADGLQLGSQPQTNARHFSNTMFNLMRGGIFDYNYAIDRDDFQLFLEQTNKPIFDKFKQELETLPGTTSHGQVLAWAAQLNDVDVERISYEYLPLLFSRRHGDPSRPWNQFSIELKNEDGSKKLNYQGNWRDIFQNWEALGLSFPAFVESMIIKFLNASTADGYNPYRITREGIDWESPDPEDPWAYIGYWGDHQIIYLQKLLELSDDFYPGQLEEWYLKELFVYANVPYRIKSFEQIVNNPKDTIEFDHDLNERIMVKADQIGADGKLLEDQKGNLIRANLLEKMLVTLLAKLSNFIPEAGIWLNTQRPEWNDANNALVGNGVSMVTLYYIRRFVKFWLEKILKADYTELAIQREIKDHFDETNECFKAFESNLNSGFSADTRYQMTEILGQAGSRYRNRIYKGTLSAKRETLKAEELHQFLELLLKFIDQSIGKNRRSDGLYHAYNLISINDQKISIRHLYEMLEGQVAILSAGYLTPAESLKVMDQLKQSKLFREDQYSYLLYPDRQLPRFEAKNIIPREAIDRLDLFNQLAKDGNNDIIRVDIKGGVHFNGFFRNQMELEAALDQLDKNRYEGLIEKEKDQILELYESLFDHQSFTGRSGTFFGYEGLGSIYWHMVSKLLLAVQESYFDGLKNGENFNVLDRIKEHYYEIKAGIGWYKSPDEYGAFPIDAYSHTPANSGAKQPGLTGQVKEDFLSRIYEIGIEIDEGKLFFRPALFNQDELLNENSIFSYFDTQGNPKQINLTSGQFGFTFIQVPIIYEIGDEELITIDFNQGESISIEGNCLGKEFSKRLFDRDGGIKKINYRFLQKH